MNSISHYGIPNQKWGIRRWQNEDGTFNEEGKERYFGKKPGGLLDRFVKGIKSARGINNDDSKAEVIAKICLGTLDNLIAIKIPGTNIGIAPAFSTYFGADKANRNAEKLGINESMEKSSWKTWLLGNLGADRYNIRRKEGQGRIRSFFGSQTVDPLKNLVTLGKSTYKQKEKYGLEHQEID